MSRATQWSLVGLALAVGVGVGAFFSGNSLVGQPAAPPVMPREMTSYRDVVKRVLPAVVSIESKFKPRMDPRRRGRIDGFQNMPDDFRRFFEDMDRFQQQQRPGENTGFGSGFVVDPTGVILTNFHVVTTEDESGRSVFADTVEITFTDGRKLVGKDIRGDAKTDIAIVRVKADKPLPSLDLGDSDAMEIGDRVLAVGAPFGLTGSVTSGIISAKGRNLRLNMYEDFLQTDAAINPGNSGGPLVNLEGRVIGINSAIKSRSGGFQGIGLAIASNLVRTIMKDLQTTGTVKRGYLGITIRDLDPEIANRLGIPNVPGVIVTRAIEGGPAEKGGLRAGDVIVSIGGQPVKDGRELQMVVARLPLGRPAEVLIYREKKAMKVNIVIEEQPEDLSAAPPAVVPGVPRGGNREIATVRVEAAGIELMDLNAERATRMGLPAQTKGALVLRVIPRGPAERAGMTRGEVIVKIDDQPVGSAVECGTKLDEAMKAPKGALVQFLSPDGGSDYVVLKSDTE